MKLQRKRGAVKNSYVLEWRDDEVERTGSQGYDKRMSFVLRTASNSSPRFVGASISIVNFGTA